MSPAADEHTSYWIASAPGPVHAALGGDLAVDVAVVGGGVAGVSVAHELARRGYRVAVLEADRVAAGVSGHTTAKVSSLHGAIYGHLAKAFGAGTATVYAGTQELARRHVIDVVARLGLDCDLEARPAYLYTESADGVDALRAEADAAAAAGLPASFTTVTGLPFDVAGAVRVDDQSMFHPRRYLLGLVADLVRTGGQVYERTRVTDLTEGEPCELTTATGHRVRADHVVVATHYPIFDRALLFARLVPRREFAVAAPIDAAAEPPGMYLSEAGGIRSLRTAPYRDGRLLIATGGTFTPGDSKAAQQVERLTDWLRERFDVPRAAFVWAAQDNHSSDRLPFIGPLHPLARNTWVATGFGGWGMTNGVLAGLLLTELIDGKTPSWAGIYDPRRVHLRTEARPVVRAAAHTVSEWAASRLRAVLRSAGGVGDIAPGEAGVVDTDGARWAVHRDDGGKLHAVSATCTHMGCEVAFNPVEREWECPCHGSRFGLDGAVLQGPATAPLRVVDLGP